MTPVEVEPRSGWVAPELAQELPGLELLHVVVPGRVRRSPPGVRRRLAMLSDRFTGARAVSLRREPVPAAYRALFRQMGLDPDETRTPPEEAALERMRSGGFRSRGLPHDALLVATVETGVATLALDADHIDGEPGLRLAGRRERLGGEQAPVLRQGQVVLADASRPLGTLFGELVDGLEIDGSTERMILLAVRARGVPRVIAEEALWIAADVLAAEG
jgi:DNA/RNA-binding domain of Phe-tRNA-synthetase-like protein